MKERLLLGPQKNWGPCAVVHLALASGRACHSWHIDCTPNGYDREQADNMSLFLAVKVDNPVAVDKLVVVLGK
jgi:hypothetical protein